MKKLSYLITVIIAVSIFASCSKDKSNPNYLKIDAKSYSLNTGYVNDGGTNLTASPAYRKYTILLQDAEIDPSAYIKFKIYSTSTTELATGTYTYSWSNLVASKFSFFEYGYGIVWDNTGTETDGTFFYESTSNINSGTITVGKASNGNYTFDITMEVVVGSVTKTVTCKFEDILTSSDSLPSY